MNAPLSTILSFPFEGPPPPGEVCEVAPGIFWLRMPLPFALDHINLWLLADGDTWTQVDCGYGDAATRALWEKHFVATLERKPLGQVVATHYHPDHLGNAAWLADRFRCIVAMPQAEYLTAHAISDERAGYGSQSTCDLFAAHGLGREHIAELLSRGNRYQHGVPELPRHYRRIAAGDLLAIGRHQWRVIPGYGHSPEHAALYCKDLGVCISGDMLLPRISTNVSVWPVEPDGDPLARFLGSLDAYAQLPPDTLILPSHGLPFLGAALRVTQLRAHHVARLGELEGAAVQSVTASDVLPVLFRRPLDMQQRFFAMGEAIAHMNNLWHSGRLHRAVGADGMIRFERAASPRTNL
jgi:glyoxylase-like metal-dependent hydrolase (beta-lactamase superfamily II)